MNRILAIALIAISLTGCAKGRFGPDVDTEAPKGPHTLKKLSVAERQQVMERARVWRPLDTSSLNMIAGPVLPKSQVIPAEVTCSFVFPEKKLTGMTPKFNCDLGDGDEVKVKYGEKNGEVYAEVAASRLLWALGFKADTMLPTRVTCRNCPVDPFAMSSTDWRSKPSTDVATRVFDAAVIERDLPGKKIEVSGFEGWAWPELDKIRQQRAHIDAFKLLAVFIQHSDSKPDQQAIVCADGANRKDARGNETCRSAWLVIKDLGATFGKSTRLNSSKMNLEDWDSAGVWKPGQRCVGDLPRSMTGSLEDPVISEAGRRFLARRLAMLSDRQIRDLFTVSQIEKRGEEITGANGRKRDVTVDDWVRVFKRKRAEIASARCQA